MNPGIVKTVAFLNEAGFRTVDSGDGKTHDFGCDRDFPYVVIDLDTDAQIEAEADYLAGLLSEAGVLVHPVGSERNPQIQATYDPADGSAFLELMHVDDALLFPTTRSTK